VMAVKEKPWSRVLLTVALPAALVALILMMGVNPLQAGVLILTIGLTGFILSKLEDMGKIDNEDKVFGLLFGVGAALLAQYYVATRVLAAQTPYEIALGAAIAGSIGSAAAVLTSFLLNRLLKARVAPSARLVEASEWLE